MNNKGITLIELLGIFVLIMIIFTIISFIIQDHKNTECHYTTKGIICEFKKTSNR